MLEKQQKTALFFAFTALVLGGISLFLVLQTLLQMKANPSPKEFDEILAVWLWPMISLGVFTVCLILALLVQASSPKKDSTSSE